ncbi:MAG: hypothetical protein IT452_13035 [Planctomycetia bacterium]|nr:hypothetical protein [Planctomycetia bacterium]
MQPVTQQSVVLSTCELSATNEKSSWIHLAEEQGGALSVVRSVRLPGIVDSFESASTRLGRFPWESGGPFVEVAGNRLYVAFVTESDLGDHSIRLNVYDRNLLTLLHSETVLPSPRGTLRLPCVAANGSSLVVGYQALGPGERWEQVLLVNGSEDFGLAPFREVLRDRAGQRFSGFSSGLSSDSASVWISWAVNENDAAGSILLAKVAR